MTKLTEKADPRVMLYARVASETPGTDEPNALEVQLNVMRAYGVALPFVVDDPRTIDPAVRIAPALSQALIKCREADLTPERVLQVTSLDRPALPADLRKWPLAVGETMPLNEMLARPTESVDVLATSMLFWDHVINTAVPHDSEQLIQQIHAVLSKGGVWYLADVLPAEMPAHWLFSYIPELWEWAHTRTRDLHALYQQIQAVGFKLEVHRTRHYQAVTLGAALELATERSGPLAQMSERAFEQGLAKLRGAIDQQGAEHVIGSEVTLIETWAQKSKV